MVSRKGYEFWLFLRLGLFSAAFLLFQVTLTRLFSVAQFYHFAFLVISMAMMGYAASGFALALLKRLVEHEAIWIFERCAVGGAVSILAAYLILNHLPFDSFSIVWDKRQALLFGLNYLVLCFPFFLNGLGVSALLSAFPHRSARLYGVNFLGAGLGCLFSFLLPARLGGEGTVLVGCALTALCGLSFSGWDEGAKPQRSRLHAWLRASAFALFLLCSLEIAQRWGGRTFSHLLDLRLSPYKSLSYALQLPNAEHLLQRWNAFSRVDVVRSENIRSLPGLSVQYQQPPPPQDGLFVDGDDLSPIITTERGLEFTAYLPSASAFLIRPAGRVLVLEPRGGLDIWTAVQQGAVEVTAVEANPLIAEAAALVYRLPQVRLVLEDQRSFLRRTDEQYDIIVLSLVSSFHPVRSGAYSFAEDYRYTVESFMDLIRHTSPSGIVVMNRWVQKPPSEELRAFATAVTALESLGLDPQERLVAYRGYSMATILIKRQPFTAQEMEILRAFTHQRAFDLIYAPGLQADETNRYNVQESSLYAQTFQAVLHKETRNEFYRAYPYDVRPPTDDHPFFGHTFKWSQARQTLAEMGTVWQPFGGAGMLAVLGLLVFVSVLGGGLIALAWFWTHRKMTAGSKLPAGLLGYFLAIGAAYMLVEIPLIQRFQLYLAHPVYAVAGVLFALLVFSGVGSALSHRIPLVFAFPTLLVWLWSSPWWFSALFQSSLGLPLPLRMIIMMLTIAPGGMLMGVAFPAGIRLWLRGEGAAWLPLAWTVNGAASVTASVGAMALALSLGFMWTLRLGALGYLAAMLMALGPAGLRRSLRR
ncbi:MAG: hypothetical protein ACOY16_11790 [Chloroflexota bacterium]